MLQIFFTQDNFNSIQDHFVLLQTSPTPAIPAPPLEPWTAPILPLNAAVASVTMSSLVLLTQPQGLDVGNLHQLALLVAVRVSSGSVQLQRSFAAGVATSPNYPGLYSNHLNVRDKIEVDQGLVIVVQFTDFNTEKTHDWLTITDGDGTALLRKTSGARAASLPTNISSRSNVINTHFVTDRSALRSGWSFSWSAVTPGGATHSLQIAARSVWVLDALIAYTEDSALFYCKTS